ncbi:hypothetical protein ENUP19_0134G0009 [Entamoeba nuttalli]|uniref:Competence/damage-inducible protein, putative n=2 Tax=Entamoeba nuttalli TaxID=412467 RepID=K2H146_ENTNP|nr:competence/damage-inducible protein, putative [Entamoeba nuttalli P19]EKE41233.1 competence/damage-inducible protein, putative [Entamoeba nuttalli P19]|eukprot:XP_008856433.1 competence/damage-inducible protein, putative [Entamoeba nuttalli P19]
MNCLQLSEEIIHLLIKKHLTFSSAESCSAGRITSNLTSVPGSSAVIRGGIVAYCNEVKAQVLGVSQESINKYTEVSYVVAQEMAERVKQIMKSDCSASITGYAGPSPSLEESKVGLIYICVIVKERIEKRELHLKSDRLSNVNEATRQVLSLLLELLKEE